MNNVKDNNLSALNKDEKLKSFLKNSLREGLIATGRRLVVEKGADFLTARKLSEASKCSVGSIYNQFGNMDSFVEEQNIRTLEELYAVLDKIILEEQAYLNLNRYVDVFVNFVIANPNLWTLLFGYHLRKREGKLPPRYLKSLMKISDLCEVQLEKIFSKLTKKEKKLAWQVLMTSLFALSGFLTGNGLDKFRGMNRRNVCKLLLNTYLAGLSSLKRK